MIEGVKIKELKINKDSRGDFREVLRIDGGLLEKIAQISISRTLPGIIKAFHWHKFQEDVFYVLGGKIKLVLYDSREKSNTKYELQDLILDNASSKAILIPRGVLHGYKVLGEREAEVLYIMNNTYNPDNPDEQRVPFNDPKINYDWES